LVSNFVITGISFSSTSNSSVKEQPLSSVMVSVYLPAAKLITALLLEITVPTAFFHS
jgi:hypothetical protein